MSIYRTQYFSAQHILATHESHIQIHERLIVPKSYVRDFSVILRTVQFVDGTSDIADESCVKEIVQLLNRRILGGKRQG